MSRTAKLTFEGREIELPVEESTEGELAVDVSKLRDAMGMVTLDQSLANTAICRSEITFIDGDQGILRYRGIPIEQLVDRPNFVEIAWLLIFGHLPNRDELAAFSEALSNNQLLHEGLRHQFQHIPVDAPPMAILSAMLNNLACFHQELLSVDDTEQFAMAAARLISKVRTIAAFSYRRSRGLPIIHPDPALRYCANFLHMMFSVPYRHYVIDPEVEDALNLIFILHADHEQNCSTATVRTVGSARANLFASCAAGVCALWGPLHGGANVEVVRMLEEIAAGGLQPEECIRMAKDKQSNFRLYGFGHSVYKNPRCLRPRVRAHPGPRSIARHRAETRRVGACRFVFR
jgi:citrate synthase